MCEDDRSQWKDPEGNCIHCGEFVEAGYFCCCYWEHKYGESRAEAKRLGQENALLRAALKNNTQSEDIEDACETLAVTGLRQILHPRQGPYPRRPRR